MEQFLNKGLKLFKKNKKKIIFITIGGIICYYLYKKYLSEKVFFLRQLYKKISEETNIMNDPDNLTIKYENSFNNLITRLLDEIKQRLDNEFNLPKVFNMITTAPKEEMPRYWILFKNKNLIYLHCAMFITRSLILISQTQLLILEKLNSKHTLPKNFLDDILTELWLIAQEYIDHLMKYIENKLAPFVDQIIINHNYNRENFINEIFEFRNRIEEVVYVEAYNEVHYEILEPYFKLIGDKITTLESCQFNNDTKSHKTNAFLKFYQINYDLLTSNLFQGVLMKSLDLDFIILSDAINLNFQNNTTPTVSVPKIINFINKINNHLLDKDNTIFFFKNYKDNEFYEEVKEYFRIIYEL
jgi:hypothetical protein